MTKREEFRKPRIEGAGTATLFAAAALSIALSGCTASTPSDSTRGWGAAWNPYEPASTVTLQVGEGVSVPQGLASALGAATGLDVVVAPSTPSPEGEAEADPPDLFLGVLPAGDPQAETAEVVGEEDICILADLSWYSANKQAAPADKAALSGAHLLSILGSSDPSTSGPAAINMPLWVSTLTTVKDETTAGGTPPPGRIASSLEAVRATNNLGTDVRYPVVEGTCVSAPTYLVDLVPSARGGAARALADYLMSPEGQEVLGAHALTYPTVGSADLPQRSEAAEAFTAKEVEEAITAWDKAFGH